jgi:Spy/CpxP family protein refolding chaperone
MRPIQAIYTALFACSLVAATADAQPAPGADPFAEVLFPPELVMQHQAAIELSAAQRQSVVDEVTRAQADILPQQMDMAQLGERLRTLLTAPRVDEEAALATAGEIMEIESRIKTRHLELAIRIKNLLSEEQQTRLAQLR